MNDAYRLAPWADVHYFADAQWWRWHKDRPEFGAFAGERCSIEPTGFEIDDPAVHILRNAGPDGLALDGTGLATGYNSGHQALNLAILAGAARVLLLGYDGKPGAGGQMHWFGDHPVKTPPSWLPLFCRKLREAAPLIAQAGVEVVNCSPGSAIDAFRRGGLQTEMMGTPRQSA